MPLFLGPIGEPFEMYVSWIFALLSATFLIGLEAVHYKRQGPDRNARSLAWIIATASWIGVIFILPSIIGGLALSIFLLAAMAYFFLLLIHILRHFQM